MSKVSPYSVAAIQADVHVASGPGAELEEAMHRNIARHRELIGYLLGEPRYGPKVVVLPEFGLTGVPEARTLEAYRSRAIYAPGRWIEPYQSMAQEFGVHLALNIFEVDDVWPGQVFNTSLLIGPNGDILSRYRKLNDSQTGIVCYSNPGDFWKRYVDHYGNIECLAPVVDTPLGKIGLLTCYDVRFAELSRVLALQGAEVLLHLTSEGSGALAWRQSWESAKFVRAWENQCYFVSANSGRTLGSVRPEGRQRGRSMVIGPDGSLLAVAESSDENIVVGPVDIAALRRARAARIGLNVPATARVSMYAEFYRKYDPWPENAYGGMGPTSDESITGAQGQALDALRNQDIWPTPQAGEAIGPGSPRV